MSITSILQLKEFRLKSKDNLDWIILKDMDLLKVFEDADSNNKIRIIVLVIDKIMVYGVERSYNVHKRIDIFWIEFK